ncbi:MAG: metallophosphoesterase family protein, partial [Candidatus Nanohaloarchaea archaeon]
MQLLAAGDFHGDEELKEAAQDEAATGGYDLFINIGDFETADYYLDLIDDITIPFLGVTGNWDFGFEPPDNDEYDFLFNYQKVEFEEYKILLIGSVYPDDLLDDAHEFFEGTPR